jgi:alpha-glucosidase
VIPRPARWAAPHHDGSALYVSEPRPRLGDTVTVRVRVPEESGFDRVHLRTVTDGEGHFVPAHREEGSAPGQAWWRADLVVRHPVTSYRFVLEGGPTAYAWLNAAGLWQREVPDAGDFRLTTFGGAADWARDAVVYQVFLDRFADSGAPREWPTWALPAEWTDPVDTRKGRIARQLYGGDLDGVAAHLDHVEALGANAIYLTPFFPARSNHRYDASSFARVDPVLGGDAALERLCRAAEERGMRVVGDLTTNHTGDAHEWFAEALASASAPLRSRYYIAEDNTYEAWLGVRSLPKLNWASEDLRDALFGAEGVVRAWLRAGLAGWRVDVANMTGRLGDEDRHHDVARWFRAAARAERGDAVVIGEHAHDFTPDLTGDGWDGVMNYAGFTRPVWTWLRNHGRSAGFLGAPVIVPELPAELMVESMVDFTSRVPWDSMCSSWNLVGSHDTTRVRTLVGDEERRVDAAAGLLFTFPSTPMFTYGDEIGMEGEYGEDGRRPMPWDESAWDERIHAVYRDLIAVRRSSIGLRAGGLRFLYAEGDAVVYLREHPEETVLVHVARAAHPPIRLPARALPGVEAARAAYGPAPVSAGGELVLSAAQAGAAVSRWPTPAGDRPRW